MDIKEKLLYNIQNGILLIAILLFLIICLMIILKSNSILGYVFYLIVVILAWFKASQLDFIELKGGKR